MAFTTIPQYMLGKTQTCVVTPFTIAANGAITEGTPVTVTAYLNDFGSDSNFEIEEISPITNTQQNQVPITTLTGVEIGEIVPVTGISALRLMAQSSSYVKVVSTTGSTPATLTLYGPILGVSKPIRTKGKVVVTMRVGQSAGNDSNPAYA